MGRFAGSFASAHADQQPCRTTHFNCNYSSGGFIADSQVTANVNSCSQQQWFTRNSVIGSWTGSVWNMVFAGVEGAPFSNYPSNTFTVLPTTPVSREKPFLYVDHRGGYRVFVPTIMQNSSGISWSRGLGEGYSLPIDDFFIAQPTTALADINKALALEKFYSYTRNLPILRRCRNHAPGYSRAWHGLCNGCSANRYSCDSNRRR